MLGAGPYALRYHAIVVVAWKITENHDPEQPGYAPGNLVMVALQAVQCLADDPELAFDSSPGHSVSHAGFASHIFGEPRDIRAGLFDLGQQYARVTMHG